MEDSSTDFLLGQANWAVSVGAEKVTIRVLSLGGNADVGLEVCNREYILLRGACSSFKPHQ